MDGGGSGGGEGGGTFIRRVPWLWFCRELSIGSTSPLDEGRIGDCDGGGGDGGGGDGGGGTGTFSWRRWSAGQQSIGSKKVLASLLRREALPTIAWTRGGDGGVAEE
jgi:hypothetical protein